MCKLGAIYRSFRQDALERPSQSQFPAITTFFLALTIISQSSLAQSAARLPELVLQSGHTGSITAIAFSPSGRVLASSSDDQTVKLWEIPSGIEVRTLVGHLDTVQAIAFSPNGRWLASTSYDKTIKVWDATNGTEYRTMRNPTDMPFLNVSFDPKSKWVVSVDADGEGVTFWDFVKGEIVKSLFLRNPDIISTSFSADGHWFCQGGTDGSWKVWDVVSGREVSSLPGNNKPASKILSAIALSRDGRWISSGGYASSIHVWEVSTGREVSSLTDRVPSGDGNSFSPDGTHLASTVDDKTIVIWNIASRREERTFTDPSGIKLVAYSPDGKWLAASTEDDNVELWEVATGAKHSTSATQFGLVTSVRFSPDGHWLASSSTDNTARLWDLGTGRQQHSLRNTGVVNAVAFSPDSRWLVSGGGGQFLSRSEVDAKVRLWDVKTGAEKYAFPGHSRSVLTVAYSPDGHWIASGSEDDTVKVWNTATMSEEHTLKGHYASVTSVNFGADSRWVAAVAGGTGSGVRLWDTLSGKALSEPFTNQSEGEAVAFSPDGRWVAFDDGKGLHIWNLRTQREEQLIIESKSVVNFTHALAFNPNGSWLAAAGSFPRDSRDDKTRIWDVKTGQLVHTLTGHTFGVNDVQFSPDGRWLVTGSADGTVRIWDAKTGSQRLTLMSHGDKDWLAIAPDGLFDGTADAMRTVYWKNGNNLNVASLDSFFSDFYRPGLLAEALSDNPPHSDLDLGVALQIPGLRTLLTEKRAHVETSEGKPVLCFEEVPGIEVQQPVGFGIDVPTEVNGYRVVPSQATCKYQRDLPGDTSAIIGKLQNEKPAVFSTTYEGKMSETKKSVLHVLCIGVSNYPSNSGFDPLPYAAASAHAIESFFTQQQAAASKAFGKIRVWPGLYEAHATRDSIRRRFTEIANAVTEDDVVFIYFVGHGVIAHGTEMFYYVPSDGKYTEITTNGLNTAMLAEALRDMPARRIVLVIDACQSGGAIEPLAKIGEIKARVEQQRAKAEIKITPPHEHGVGVHIVAATLPLSYAIGFKTGQSALATTLLDGLHQAGSVTIDQVVDFLKANLPASSMKGVNFSQVPMTQSIGLDFVIATN